MLVCEGKGQIPLTGPEQTKQSISEPSWTNRQTDTGGTWAVQWRKLNFCHYHSVVACFFSQLNYFTHIGLSCLMRGNSLILCQGRHGHIHPLFFLGCEFLILAPGRSCSCQSIGCKDLLLLECCGTLCYKPQDWRAAQENLG